MATAKLCFWDCFLLNFARVEYALTEFGASLEPILKQLNLWGEKAKKIKSA
ncbi:MULTISPECIES: winged helix-turn-helix transcriptional regulator [Chryseobacterium]|uniref:winged helix-turn-helix transcriptional regulator n=1 Tax=Chryseobacterium TaxID=59732 RepID=UPI001032FF18|nr:MULTISPECIES: winged helix-turn-helix transcriptional regulator [Chryseobacterium]QQV03494.1 winged helix-turn-helix transcriptional regulator [Chryseobacterium sp. FDAARGOS 1104]